MAKNINYLVPKDCMIVKIWRIFLFNLYIVLVISCSNTKTEIYPDKPELEIITAVEVDTIKKASFIHESIFNGVLKANKKSVLSFNVEDVLKVLNVNNGKQVYKGDLIASINDEGYLLSLEIAKENLLKSGLDYTDLLLSQGYTLSDTSNAPAEVKKVARIRSGYYSAINNYKKAQLNLKETKIIAPFDGIIANLNHSNFETVNAREDFCILIDNSKFEVEFTILETELMNVQVGNLARIEPFAHQSLERTGNEITMGIVTEINPIINENGLIKVKASIEGSLGLMDGMNVKVFVEKRIPEQLIVPRSAVVLRQKQHVIFRYIDGVAYWTYIDILYENSSTYAVCARKDKNARLVSGDKIIISGNLNLAHETKVSISN